MKITQVSKRITIMLFLVLNLLAVALPASASGEFQLISPEDGAQVNKDGGPITFSWTPSAGATDYRLEIKFLNMGNPVPVASYDFTAAEACTGELVCSVQIDLSDWTTKSNLFWGVVAIDENGETGASNNDFAIGLITELPELVIDGDFEQNLTDNWVKKGKARQLCNTESKTVSFEGDCAVRIAPSSLIRQNVILGETVPTAGDVLKFSGYGKTTAGKGKLKVVVKYVDSQLANDKINIAISGKPYAYYNENLTLQGEVESVRVIFNNRSTTGRMWVDGASLLFKQNAPQELLPLPAAAQ